jgi:tetratricopeptide (TPR) repeat protein
VLALIGGLGMLLHAGPLPWQRGARRLTATSVAGQHAQPASHAARPPAAAAIEGEGAAAPASGTTQDTPAAEPAAQAPARVPTARELKQARSTTLRGHRYLRADRHETAALAYLKALAIAPDYAPAIAPLVRIYLDDANAPDALRWAQRLATLAANDGDAQLLLGDAHELNGDAARATAAWQRASTLGNAAARKRLAQP